MQRHHRITPQLVAAVHSFNSLPLQPWITAPTIPTTLAAAILGLHHQEPTGPHSASGPPTISRRPRCLRRLPRTARTVNSMATWATRTRKADWAWRLRMAIIYNNRRWLAKTRLGHLSHSNRVNTDNNRRGTMETGRSVNSSSTSFRPRSPDWKEMERRTRYCDSMFMYV